MFFFLLMVPVAVLALLSVIYLVPFFNRLFGLVWEDPSERQRKEVLARLKELHVDGHLPEEVTVLLAAKEFNATEDELMKLVGMMSASDMKAVLSGRKSLLGVVLHGIETAVKRRTKLS